ncbi:MAG: type II toxin-antitoxin system HicA family toxin [Minisyncoccia bacterium]
MPKQRRLSGKEVISFCERHNFNISRQKGSHVNLVRVAFDVKQVVTVPNHKEIDRGTLHNIFKKLLPFIPEKDLQKFFYTD